MLNIRPFYMKTSYDLAKLYHSGLKIKIINLEPPIPNKCTVIQEKKNFDYMFFS